MSKNSGYQPHTNIVSVQYESRCHPGEFAGNAYSYITEHRLAVGDVVKVPTKYGTNLARVAEIDVPEYKVAKIKDLLKHITNQPKPPSKSPAQKSDTTSKQLSLAQAVNRIEDCNANPLPF